MRNINILSKTVERSFLIFMVWNGADNFKEYDRIWERILNRIVVFPNVDSSWPDSDQFYAAVLAAQMNCRSGSNLFAVWLQNRNIEIQGQINVELGPP